MSDHFSLLIVPGVMMLSIWQLQYHFTILHICKYSISSLCHNVPVSFILINRHHASMNCVSSPISITPSYTSWSKDNILQCRHAWWLVSFGKACFFASFYLLHDFFKRIQDMLELRDRSILPNSNPSRCLRLEREAVPQIHWVPLSCCGGGFSTSRYGTCVT